MRNSISLCQTGANLFVTLNCVSMMAKITQVVMTFPDYISS